MKKQWAIVFLVVVAIWGSFMTYRHLKSQEEEDRYVTQTFSSMTKAAQQSPKAGLTYMGVAIKRYKTEKNQYPETLETLYPDYIRDRSFLDEVNWEYSFDKDNFRLAKTVVINQQPYTAFVDSQLRPTDVGGAGEVRTAAAGQASSSDAGASQTSARPSAGQSQAAAARVPAQERTVSREELEAMKQQLLASLAGSSKQGPPPEEEETIPRVIYTAVDDAEDVDEAVAGRHLTWKTETGALGFGNVMYPGGEENLIYRKGKWVRVQRTQAELPAERTGQAGPSPEAADLAQKHGSTYLAWKDKTGAMGFGNVAYPELDQYTVYRAGRWVTATGQTPADILENPLSYAKASREQLAQKHGKDVFVWKDRSGTLGFGNTLPEQKGITLMKPDGTWVDATDLSESGGEK